ncbi:malic enzyme-like NAD(P)-binding protein [Cryobacterium sp.]|uniref:NAD(P)-dependent malic enzyme n=1 Tax=Cryobacterium sp. TaxID=1926290 RepID=UPI0026151B3B|nr:malic enzyme-like NAD(P)-binding protein [Cryobacterium sp.]MCU1444456.1 NAD-dependent malic enzyme [Cryobacterium sp.]
MSLTIPVPPAVAGTAASADVSSDEIFAAHEGGKLRISLARPIDTRRDLAIVYTPGVAEVSRAIHKDAAVAAEYTWASRLVAVVSDGTAVLGLGDIGPAAALPVMEGKAALFQRFGGLNSIPLVLDTTDVDEIVETLVRVRHSFGAVNLEDVSAPRCFELEAKLIEALDMPVMHDDQHGTAVVVLAALTNGAKVLGRDLAGLRVVVAGAGAAGIAIAALLLEVGIPDVVLLNSRGILSGHRIDLTGVKAEFALTSNPRQIDGGPAQALAGADVFVGVSSSTVDESLLATMSTDAMILALSKPDPEVTPDVAARFARIVATGRSDYPNQINNVLAFPGIFRGALDAGARRITTVMKIAAAMAPRMHGDGR